jgi:hypothetical protein
MELNNPHIKKVRFAWEGPFTSSWTFVLILETDLQLNPQHADFDFEAADSIRKSAEIYVGSQNRQFDYFRIVSTADQQVG